MVIACGRKQAMLRSVAANRPPHLPICRVLPMDLCRCCGKCSAQILIFVFVMSHLFPVYCFAAHLPGSSFGARQSDVVAQAV